MKVLMAHNHYRLFGGEDQCFINESKLLEDRGHEVVRYTRHNDETECMGRLSLAASMVWNGGVYRELRELMRREKPDVVHLQNTFAVISPAAVHAARAEGIPVVMTLRNYRLICPNGLLLRGGRICEECVGRGVPWPGVYHGCYRGSRQASLGVASMLSVHRLLRTWGMVDSFITFTDFIREKLAEGGLPADKITLKPHFVDPDPGIREGGGDYAIFVGRLSPEKGVLTMLRAWDGLDVPLKVAGTGPLMEEAESYVKSRGLGLVELLGELPNDEVLNLMKGARFLVFPSEWYEAFGFVITEAYACGLPVVASRLGTMTEAVADGRTGLHFEAGDPRDLAVKVRWAWTHEEEMREMGLNARREFEEKYTADKNYWRLMEIYNAVAGGG